MESRESVRPHEKVRLVAGTLKVVFLLFPTGCFFLLPLLALRLNNVSDSERFVGCLPSRFNLSTAKMSDSGPGGKFGTQSNYTWPTR